MKTVFRLMAFGLLFPVLVRAQQEPDLGTEAQRQAGKQLYMKLCSQCHGENGDGNGIATPFFKPAPRDFTAGKYKFRTTPTGELPTTEDIKRAIRLGMPYTGMPPWPGLSDKDLTNLAYYLKTFNEDFADPDYVPEPIEIPKPPDMTEESIEKGREVYVRNECFSCHGDQGRGNGPSAPTLKDDWGHHIKPADLTKRWTFRGGPTRRDIYRTFTTGLNGTPMPSYADIISEEDRWHLVNYVYSLGDRDEPEYSTVAVAKAIEGEIDLSQGRALFAEAPEAFFPIVGQVIEPGRSFFPGVDAVAVRAVYNATDIAIMLSWHDMSAETQGENSPAMPVPPFKQDTVSTPGQFSDAVAIQFPSKMPEGVVKPYFLFGDLRNPVDIWFMDLARKQVEVFIGKGSTSLTPDTSATVTGTATYDDGEWVVIFKRSRQKEEGLSFVEDTFIPVAFSVWDGFHNERGNKRGISSWYYLYLEPATQTSVAVPMAKWGLLTLLAELGIIVSVRRKNKHLVNG